jgi:hypothetical protein
MALAWVLAWCGGTAQMATVSGRVAGDDGAPCPGALVTVSVGGKTSKGNADAQGAFTLTAPPGEAVISAAGARATATLTTNGAAMVDLVCRFRTVKHRVEDAAGKPAAGTEVTLCYVWRDALVLARDCVGLILVVRMGQTHRKTIERAQEQLAESRLPVLGCILNDFSQQTRENAYYYNYYKRYGGDGNGFKS